MLALLFAIPLLAGLLITPVVIRLATVCGWYDQPTGGRRVHTVATPRLGGVAVFLAATLGMGAAASLGIGDGFVTPEQQRFHLALLCGGGLLFGVGVVDDLRGVSPRGKVAAQTLAAVIFWLGGLRIERLLFGTEMGEQLVLLSLPLVVLWVVTITNSFNLIDGLDGLAAGIAMVAFASTAAVSLLVGRPEVLVASLVLLGALSGFLRYNYRPARIFLGDSGSLFLGSMLALLSVYGISSGATAVLGVAPLFALAIPLIDTTLAVLRRWLRGAAFSDPDRRHIHHQLLARGLTHLRAVLVLHVVALTLAVFGLVLAFAPTTMTNILFVFGGACTVLLLLWGTGYLKYHEFTEAFSVMRWAPRRLRRVIRDQIHARDVAQVLAAAATMDEVNAILGDNASNFGFLDMQLCLESESVRARPVLIEQGHRVHPRKFEYPVHALDHHGEKLYVLRIWCHAEHHRPAGAERVSGVLGPALEQWILARLEEAAPLPALPARKVTPELTLAEISRR